MGIALAAAAIEGIPLSIRCSGARSGLGSANPFRNCQTMLSRRATLLMSPVIALVLTVPVCAQSYPGGWGGRGMRSGWPDGPQRVVTQGNAEPSKRIDVETF
eukprot:gene23784-30368_t